MNYKRSMKLIITIIVIFGFCLDIYASKNEDNSTRNYMPQYGDKIFLKSVALGIASSALAKCAGESLDTKTIKTAGTIQLLGEIKGYEQLKILQQNAYKYKKTKYGDVNDSQKLSLTGEQYIDNKKMKKILEEKLKVQKGVLSAHKIAQGIALKELYEMKHYLTKCKKAIYDGAYKPIWLPKKQKWVYGQCEKDWGDSNWTGEVLCPNYEKAEAEYQAAPEHDKAKYKAARDAAFATCNKCAMATGDMSRMFVGTGAVCSKRCILAANEIMACNRALKVVNTGGIPLINKLELKVNASTANSKEIIETHHSTFTRMYRICGRETLLNNLLSIKSLGERNDIDYQKLVKESKSVAKEHGGDAYTIDNKIDTKTDRDTNKIHTVNDYKEIKSNKKRAGYEKLTIKKENVYKENKFNPTKAGEATPMCSDAVRKYCGEYSKRLMTSLNSCSNTIQSTINIRTSSNSKTATGLSKRIGESLGIGGKLLNSLNNLQIGLKNQYDPYLATYNKRIYAHQIGINIMNLTIHNTIKSINNVKDRLKAISNIKRAYGTGKKNGSIIAEIPKVLDLKQAKGIEKINQSAIYRQLWGTCGDDNCLSEDNFNINENTITQEKDLINADNKIIEGALLLSSIKTKLSNFQSLTPDIMQNIKDLGNQYKSYSKANNTLKTFVNNIISENQGKEIDFHYIEKNALAYISNEMKTDISQSKLALKLSMNKNKSNNEHINYIKYADNDKHYILGKGNKNNLNKNNSIKNNKEILEPQFPDVLNNINPDITSNKESSLWQIIYLRYKKVFSNR